MQKLIIVLTLALGLVGCASTSTSTSSQSITYYLLDSVQTAELSRSQTSRFVAIAPVIVAEYLSLPNLVMKQADHRIVVANYHLWAEPLAPSIKRTIMSDLSAAQPMISFVDRCIDCDSINVYVDHFYPEELGDTVFSGRYVITRANGDIENYPFTFSEPLVTDGYAAAVKAMRELVLSLVQRIAIDI